MLGPFRSAQALVGQESVREALMGEYAIRVTGRLSDALVNSFPTLRQQPLPVQTLLWGPLPDQAALQGVLDHLDELGVEILEVTQLPEREQDAAQERPA
jgi:hypothetical protein